MARPREENGRAAERGRRWSWPVTIAGLLGLVCILIISLWGYDHWANTPPVFQPAPASMPAPNGYTRAAALAAQLPPEPQIQGHYWDWPAAAPPAALARAVRPALPVLQALRGTLHLAWRRPKMPLFPAPTDLSQFLSCMDFLSAESLLAQDRRDCSAAMQDQLDSMELGAKLSRGDDLLPFLTGAAVHAMGFAGADRLVPRLPAAAIPPALERIRREWPRLTELLEIERSSQLSGISQEMQQYQHRTPLDTLTFISDQLRSAGFSSAVGPKQAFASWLAPKRSAFASLDRYFGAVIVESRKPYRQRRRVAPPAGPIFRDQSLMPVVDWTGYFDAIEAKWQEPQVELDLLEFALAIRLYWLENGHYPHRLSAIPKRWLPAVPIDPWGQPIAYRLKNGKPLIYSFGPDGRDDGGRPADARQLSASTRGDLVWGSRALGRL